jgi:hypothetical protein
MRATARAFQLQMLVEPDGPLVGRTVDDAGLRALDGLYLAAVERADRIVTVRPRRDSTPRPALLRRRHHPRRRPPGRRGLVSAEQPHLLDAEGPGVRLHEAVVGPGSALAGRTLKEAGFRARYGAAVLAVHRADGDLRGKLGAIPLHVGDVLLVLAAPNFASAGGSTGTSPSSPRSTSRHHPAARVAASPQRRSPGWCCSPRPGSPACSSRPRRRGRDGHRSGAQPARSPPGDRRRRRAHDRLSISLGNAVDSSGLAAELASRLVDLGGRLGEVGLLLVLVVATQLLTEVLSNSGAAALMVPVALAAAAGVGADPREFAIGVLVGASCSFLTPIGYQTNLMVYGLGGYRFADFTRVGLPLTIAAALTATLALSI